MRTQILILSLIIPGLSSAASYFVSTQVSLSNALYAAAVSAADDDIRLAPGVFRMPTPVSLEIQGALTLSGGWSGTFFGMCRQHEFGAKTTLLGRPENSFYLRPCAALNLERVDFVSWGSVAIVDTFSDPAPSVLPEIRISRCGFHASTRGLFLIIRGPQTRIENSLFTGNTMEGLKVFAYPETPGVKFLPQFNTFAENNFSLFVNGGNPPSRLQTRALNTVFVKQVTQDLQIYRPFTEVKHFFWNTAGILTLTSNSTGNLSGNAGLNSQLPPINGSQLIDAGASDSLVRPKFDYAGGSRLQGLRPDIGAYEAAAVL